MKPKLSQGVFVVEVNPYHVHPRAVLSHQTILSWAEASAAPGVSARPSCKTAAVSMWHLLSAFPFLRSSKIHGLVWITYPQANSFNCMVSDDWFLHNVMLFLKEGDSPWGACA